MKSKHMVALLLFLLVARGLVAATAGAPPKPLLNEELLSGLKFRAIGPAFMSGRIADVAIDPKQRHIWYVAVGSGGVWKTINGGTTFFPVFDAQGSYSIGCVTIDARDSNVIWVGSGENVSGRHVGFGDGVYRSSDGGHTWQNMGLKNSEHIDKIVLDPTDARVIYVAAEGPLWSSGGERGVFKSSDGGKSWLPSLVINADTGATDLVMHPSQPQTLYAATHQRRRHVSALINGGPGSAIYKTLDGGKNWTKLSRGLPGEDLGQIALAISPQRPEVVYACIETSIRTVTFYRSANGGSSWEKGASYVTQGTGPHYYQELIASPHQFDRIYSMEINILVSNDGGRNWDTIKEEFKHGDNHALAFDAQNPDYLLCGSDGGLYETHDNGQSWRYISNLPVTQFYRIALDNSQPFYHIVGGTQDNCTQLGPAQTLRRGGAWNTDWSVIYGGDGYSCQIDPEDENTIYCEAQVGELARYNKPSGEAIQIKPFVGADEETARWNWDSPVIISPFNHNRLYFASQRLYRSDDRGDNWRPVSKDLSRNENRLAGKFMGRSWSVNAVWDNDAMSYYGNVTTIAESPLQEGLLYCGTDDGLIQVSEDGGANWRRLENFPGVPAGTFVNEIMASKHERDVVFALFDNHQRGDFKPYILKSPDRGRSWSSLARTIPDRHILWAIEQDDRDARLLFLGSEFGVLCSRDGGDAWIKLSGGLPNIAIRDLKIQSREADLVCASFGRGIFILDDYSPLRLLSTQAVNADFTLFPARNGRLFHAPSPLGGGAKGTQGHTFFTAENAPFGVTFTYYSRESLPSLKEQRREVEKKLEQANRDVPFPGFARLKKEQRESDPGLELQIEDEDGMIVRRLPAPAAKGLQRLTWDMRHSSLEPVRLQPPPTSPFSYGGDYGGRGALVLPGKYYATVFKVQGGLRTALSARIEFSCLPVQELKLSAAEFAGLRSFQREIARLNRESAAMSEVLARMAADLEALRASLQRAQKEDAVVAADLLRLREKTADLSEELSGDAVRAAWAEPRPTSLYDQLWAVGYRGGANWSLPTSSQEEQLKKLQAGLAAFKEKLLPILQKEFPDLLQKVKVLGAPWVPGFGLYDQF